MRDAGMVIVGAGEAGARAATALREGGYAGSVTLIGEEVHPPYERPPLSKVALLDEGEPLPPTILDASRCDEIRIVHLANARVSAVRPAGREVHLTDGRVVSYERLLLATGARPRRLAVAGAEHAIYLRTIDDARSLRAALRPGARLIVIGGGFIGLEVAASAVRRGSKVTVVEAAPRLLARGVPIEIAERIHAQHTQNGVTVHLGAGVSRIERGEGPLQVTLSDGRVVSGDCVLAGIGAIPETALAEDAGLAIGNGIAADAMFRTSDPDIFAAGDCCSFPSPLYGGRRIRLEAWRNAQDQGAAAAKAMLGSADPYSAVPWFWSDQYEETLQIAGLVDEGRVTVTRNFGAARFFFHLADDGRLVAASAVGPNAAIARDIKIAALLIAARAAPGPALLVDPAVKLKGLLDGPWGRRSEGRNHA